MVVALVVAVALVKLGGGLGYDGGLGQVGEGLGLGAHMLVAFLLWQSMYA